jgi:DNA-binding NarL/FixJ family response regulator
MRLVIVDGHPLIREGMALLFGDEPDLTIVGEGATAEDAVRLVGTLMPDVVLFDINIPGGGLNLLPQLGDASPTTRAIVLTACEDEHTMLAAMQSGAQGYVLKTVSVRQLVAIIRDIHAGTRHMSPELTMRALLNMSSARAEQRHANGLTILNEHEHDILRMVSDGLSNRQIATALNRTEACIKNHMTTIMKKLQVNNRVQAAMVLNQTASGAARQSAGDHGRPGEPSDHHNSAGIYGQE